MVPARNKVKHLSSVNHTTKNHHNQLYVEVSSLGVLPKNIQEFRNFCEQYDCINVMRMMKKLSEVAISSSYYL